MKSLEKEAGECAECLEGSFGTESEEGSSLGKCSSKSGVTSI